MPYRPADGDPILEAKAGTLTVRGKLCVHRIPIFSSDRAIDVPPGSRESVARPWADRLQGLSWGQMQPGLFQTGDFAHPAKRNEKALPAQVAVEPAPIPATRSRDAGGGARIDRNLLASNCEQVLQTFMPGLEKPAGVYLNDYNPISKPGKVLKGPFRNEAIQIIRYPSGILSGLASMHPPRRPGQGSPCNSWASTWTCANL